MKLSLLLGALVLLIASTGQAQTADALGSHDLGPFGPGPVTGGLPSCQFCHAPHSSLSGPPLKPLWSQQLSTASYTLYASATIVNQEQQPALGSASNLCLSCHDGTVAPGQTTPYGKVTINGAMNGQDVFGYSLQGTHPFNFKLPLQPAPNLLPSLTSNGTTANPKVKLVNGNVECTSCHNPHVEAIDPVAKKFLVVDNSSSGLCLACHVSTPGPITAYNRFRGRGERLHAEVAGGLLLRTAGGLLLRTAYLQSGQQSDNESRTLRDPRTPKEFNPFTSWSTSVHAVASHKVSKGKNLGPYGNTRQNGCLSCHKTHNAPGGKQLLSGPMPSVPNMDAATQDCISCHGGGSQVTPAIRDVFAEFAKTGHPFPTSSTQHFIGESAVLNNNRHATCVDCHNPHSSVETVAFTSTSIRGAQSGVIGVSAADGSTVLYRATNQYENCLRCHGTSAGKQILSVFGYLPTRAVTGGDPLNLIPQFSATSKSSHPVMSDATGALPQPSLLKFMWNLDGHTQGRPIGSRMLCTDCHNSDDNREFGSTGPNGPHGSQFSHILERRYEFSQVRAGLPPAGGPGTTITNLLPLIVDPAAGGPYSLCAKCHDLANVASNASFTKHELHLRAGFSCSVCHTAHGMGASSSGISGERLVNFDVQVVAPNDVSDAPISYSRATNTCVLKCHNFNHNADGTVGVASNLKTTSRP